MVNGPGGMPSRHDEAMPMVSYAQRLADHAAANPHRVAVTDEHRSVTRDELERCLATARVATSRRGRTLTPGAEAALRALHGSTAPERLR